MNIPSSTPQDMSDAFVALLTGHQSLMLAFIQSLAPRSPGARDLLQEVNMTLWQKRDTFQLGTNFKAWAFQIIRYHFLNHRRRLAREGWLIFDDDLVEALSPTFELEPQELDERQSALKTCFEQLRQRDRDLLYHRYATNGSLSEFAQATRRSVGTLKAILFNLRAALRTCIEKRLIQQGGQAS